MIRFRMLASYVVALLPSISACTAARPAGSGAPLPASVAHAAPRDVGLGEWLPRRVDSLLTAAIADRATPGAAVAVGRNGRLVLARGWGQQDWAPGAAAVTDSTIWDLASLTKVIATTTAAMLLEEDGLLDLDRPVVSYLPEFDAPDKAGITVRMLLTHASGMKQRIPLWREHSTMPAFLRAINAYPLAHAPGDRSDYTDWNMMVLHHVVERVSGQPLDALLEKRVFARLGLRETGFNPPASRRHRIAPTEVQEFRGGQVLGVVHDENAWKLGGVSGHAGLFSSARDLAVFAQMLLDGGEYGGARILHPETIARWTARQRPDGSRAVGWDTPARGSSAGRYFSARSFGHTGFTGTSIWIDPERQLFVILLTNRVNPTRDNQKIGPLRRAMADVVQSSVTDLPLRDWEAAGEARP